MTKQVQLYDDQLDFTENKAQGPFGDYANIKEPYQNQGEPQYDFFGTPVYSPFGIGAGPLPTAKFIKAAMSKGFDIATLKSVRTATFPLNKYPQVRPLELDGSVNAKPDKKIHIADRYKEPLAVANSFGIPSVEPEEWQSDMREALKVPGKGQALVIGFQGTARGKGREDFVQDHVQGIKLIQEAGATDNVIEINLSCPNEGEAVLACFDTDITTRIVKAVREAYPDLKFMIKLAYFSDKEQLKGLVQNVGQYVDGISAINTIPLPIVDAAGNEVFPGRPMAGVSGAPIKWAGLEMVTALKNLRDELGFNYQIVGLGGVLSTEDFQKYRQAGADYVMSVTGAMWHPELAAEIKSAL